MSSSTEEDLVAVGRATRPHGLSGKIRIRCHGGWPATVGAGDSIFLGRSAASTIERRLTSIQANAGGAVVAIEGVEDREEAARCADLSVYVRRSVLPELQEGEYYWHDLVGLDVHTEGGRRLGRIEAIIETGSNDVLVVRDGSRERLLPMTDEVFLSLDRRRGRVVVRPLEGLLEEDEI